MLLLYRAHVRHELARGVPTPQISAIIFVEKPQIALWRIRFCFRPVYHHQICAISVSDIQ